MLSANKIKMVRQIDFIPITEFNGLGAATTVLDSIGAGDPVFQEIGTTGLNGLLMASDGDDIRHFMRIPTNWDRDHPIYVRVVWSSASTTSADTIDWVVLFDQIEPETTGGTVIAPATALDTAIAQDTVHGTANVVQKTANGVINGGTLLDASEYISFLVEMHDFAAGLTEDKNLLGIEFEYTPKFDAGQRGSEARAFAVDD